MKNPYIPEPVVIKSIKRETADIKTFTVSFKDKSLKKRFSFKPGQFVQVSLFGFGEAPISISSSPLTKDEFDLSIKKVGLLSSKLHSLREGEEFFVRGPYGNGFDMGALLGRDILFVGGGIGLAPIKGVILTILKQRHKFGEVILLYGARTPSDIVFKKELKEWAKRKDISAFLTVDKDEKSWKGNVGVVTTLFRHLKADTDNRVGIICGPPVMVPFVIAELLKFKVREEEIIVSLERHMKCGIGKCGHCNISEKYVCIDGPVFTYSQLKTLKEKF